jgi:type VI secretion system secreted protein Hcp
MTSRLQDDWYVSQAADVVCTDATTWVTLQGGCGGNRADLPPLPGAVVHLDGCVSGHCTLQIAEDESPRPLDRSFFDYDYIPPSVTVIPPLSGEKLVPGQPFVVRFVASEPLAQYPIAISDDVTSLDEPLLGGKATHVELKFDDFPMELHFVNDAPVVTVGPGELGTVKVAVDRMTVSGDLDVGRPVTLDIGLSAPESEDDPYIWKGGSFQPTGGTATVGPLVAIPRSTSPTTTTDQPTTPPGPRVGPSSVVPGETVVVHLPDLTPSETITIGFYDPTGTGGGGWERTLQPTWEGSTAVVTLTVPGTLVAGCTYTISQAPTGVGGGPLHGGSHTIHVESGPRPARTGLPVNPGTVSPGDTVVVRLAGLTPSETITVGFYDPYYDPKHWERTGSATGLWGQTVVPRWEDGTAVFQLTIPAGLPPGHTYVIYPGGSPPMGGPSDRGPGHTVRVEPPAPPTTTTLPLRSGDTLELRGDQLKVQAVSAQAPFALSPKLSEVTRIFEVLHDEGAGRVQALARLWVTDTAPMAERLAQLASWARHDYPLDSIRADISEQLLAAGVAEERRKKIADETVANLTWVLDQVVKKPSPSIVFDDQLQHFERTMLDSTASLDVRFPIGSWSMVTSPGEFGRLDTGMGYVSIHGFNVGSANQGASARAPVTPNPHDITVVKPVDAASTNLLRACATGEKLDKVKIDVHKTPPTEPPTPYLTYELHDAIIKGLRPMTIEEMSSEEITINFSKITFEYRQVPDEQSGQADRGYDLRDLGPDTGTGGTKR